MLKEIKPKKKCSLCKRVLSVTEDNFFRSLKAADGYSDICRRCEEALDKKGQKKAVGPHARREKNLSSQQRRELFEKNQMLLCNKCLHIKHFNSFYRSKSTWSGWTYRCKSCYTEMREQNLKAGE